MRTIREVETLREFRELGRSLRGVVIQGVDLRNLGIDWGAFDVAGAYFLGSPLDPADAANLVARGAYVLAPLTDLPYDPFRSRLYDPTSLLAGYEDGGLDGTIDARVYRHFIRTGRTEPDVVEALARRLHDHSIDDALADLTGTFENGQRLVGFMGGHKAQRGDHTYRRAAAAAREVSRAGYLVTTGGGPGVMEAANLGAYLAGRPPEALHAAIGILADGPSYPTDPVGYLEIAMRVRQEYAPGHHSLSLPTWFYGFEPTNIFATHIAKYFSNSLREDGLLAIAHYGVVFAKGGPGTYQEIFMDAAQNYYRTYGFLSPMILLGSAAFPGVHELLTGLMGKSIKYVGVVEEAGEIVPFLEALSDPWPWRPPRRMKAADSRRRPADVGSPWCREPVA